MRLLLVDDDAFLRDMYATKFEEAGHTVSVAINGAEAVALMQNGEVYDVVLMDMVMPGIAGSELLKQIIQADRSEKVKCIVLSNQGEQEDISGAEEAGAVGYIVKAESIPSQVVTKVVEIALQYGIS